MSLNLLNNDAKITAYVLRIMLENLYLYGGKMHTSSISTLVCEASLSSTSGTKKGLSNRPVIIVYACLHMHH